MTDAIKVNSAHHMRYICCRGVNVPAYWNTNDLVLALWRRVTRLDNESDVIADFYERKREELCTAGTN